MLEYFSALITSTDPLAIHSPIANGLYSSRLLATASQLVQQLIEAVAATKPSQKVSCSFLTISGAKKEQVFVQCYWNKSDAFCLSTEFSSDKIKGRPMIPMLLDCCFCSHTDVCVLAVIHTLLLSYHFANNRIASFTKSTGKVVRDVQKWRQLWLYKISKKNLPRQIAPVSLWLTPYSPVSRSFFAQPTA